MIVLDYPCEWHCYFFMAESSSVLCVCDFFLHPPVHVRSVASVSQLPKCCRGACCVHASCAVATSILQNWESPSPPAAYNPAFCVYGADCSGTLYEWTQTFVLLCLAYVTEHNAFRLHPRCRLCQNCLPFRLDNIHCVDGPWSACLFFCEGRVEYLHSSLMPCHICGIASESPRIQKSFTITYFVNFFILKSSKSQKKGRMYVSFTCICEQML